MENKKGGARIGAGRKSKAEEQSLIEKLTPLETKAFEALTSALRAEKDWAVKLYFQYKFGMPKQVIDQNNTHSINTFDITQIYSEETSEDME
jgi:phenylalanyl-tRNA synthetase alpha subunit